MNWKDIAYGIWGDDEITKKITLTPEEQKRLFRDNDTCYHVWKEYVGLNETFTYCTICDKKLGE